LICSFYVRELGLPIRQKGAVLAMLNQPQSHYFTC
jgi:hypothetical protein